MAAVLVLFVGAPLLLVGGWLVGRLAGDAAAWLKRRANEPAAPRSYGFPVVPQSALPVRNGDDGPGRYRVGGVNRATGADVTLHVDAATLANAKVKAELQGVIVTAVEKEP